MSWNVELLPSARRDLRRLDRQAQERIVAAIERFAETEHGDVARLSGYRPRQWRLRVGQWRIRFVYQYGDDMIQILRVLPRGRAYRD